jgi:hypothetical protein
MMPIDLRAIQIVGDKKLDEEILEETIILNFFNEEVPI